MSLKLFDTICLPWNCLVAWPWSGTICFIHLRQRCLKTWLGSCESAKLFRFCTSTCLSILSTTDWWNLSWRLETPRLLKSKITTSMMTWHGRDDYVSPSVCFNSDMNFKAICNCPGSSALSFPKISRIKDSCCDGRAIGNLSAGKSWIELPGFRNA